MKSNPIAAGLASLVAEAARKPATSVFGLLDMMCGVLAARDARLYIADYSLRRLQQVDEAGSVGEPLPILGTMIGRVFTGGAVQISDTEPTVVSVPLMEGSCPIGVLEFDVDAWTTGAQELLAPIVDIFVLAWIVKGRYTDHSARARRSEPLSAAAEVQWDLLPPLACSTHEAALSGILEPAYDIGGDSFDYAFGEHSVDFAIVDAVGHGMSSVLMSAAAVNSLRNSRRAKVGLGAAYLDADTAIARHFGRSYYVTGIIGSLDLPTGTLRWINAGHVLPMLVRNGTYAGPLPCAPSMPMGLGGEVVEMAEHELQRGDRVLLYTDGITEARASDGSPFGDERLADLLVRASLEHLPVQATVRHLADSIVAFSEVGLRDDATMLLLEYRPPSP